MCKLHLCIVNPTILLCLFLQNKVLQFKVLEKVSAEVDIKYIFVVWWNRRGVQGS